MSMCRPDARGATPSRGFSFFTTLSPYSYPLGGLLVEKEYGTLTEYRGYLTRIYGIFRNIESDRIRMSTSATVINK